MPSFHAPIPVLRIFDELKALEFYVGFLGFVVDWRVGGGDTPVYMQLSLGPCRLQLSEHFGDGAPGTNVKVKTDGLEEYQQSLLAKAYRHSRPGLQVQTWGEREMTIPDPFGNRIAFWDDVKPGS
jgi:uncharacterized glyoxalase superfamily protein PhnB